MPACGNCVNRGEITACCYVARKAESRTKSQESSVPADAGQDRIDRLEQLVFTLLKNGQHSQRQVNTPSSGIDVDHDTISDNIFVETSDQEHLGVSGVHDKRATDSLAGSNTVITIGADFKQPASDEAHWALLLNEIGEVRSHMRAQQRQYEEQAKKMAQLLHRTSDNSGATLLFGSGRHVSRSEILSQLPSRYSCDIIVARFWAHLYPAIYILHGPAFMRQYERFWTNESNTSIMWIGLLFAVLRIAMLDYVREGDEPPEFKGKCQDLATSFRNRLTDCLILGDYLQPHEFVMEVLCLHLYGEYVSSRDVKSSVWVLIGMIIRLAMRMGYHQHTQPALTSTPFKVEMRRRIWAYLRQADILISFQLGLPSMVGRYSLEVPLPRNINDDEKFDEDCTVLPPALPDSEPTQVSYLLMKTKLAFAFARALKEISCADTIRWERILEIDRELRRLYDNIPDHYKLGQLSSRDSLVLTSARFVLASIHHKSLCVVHSRFLEIAKTDYRYIYSRRVCLSSAMAILRFQAIQNQEIPIDGRLRSLTNYQNSLAIHDYLLAATVISADLSANASTSSPTNQPSLQGMPTRAEMIKALGLSARIFRQSQDRSMEAFKAADVLEMLVGKFEARGYNPARSPTDGQGSQSSRSSWSKSTSLMAPPISTARQTSPRPPSEDVICNPASTNPTAVIDSEAYSSNARPSRLLSHHLSRMPRSTDTQTISQERPGFSEQLDLDAFTSWPELGNNSIIQSLPFHKAFPELDASIDWAIPQDPDVPADVYQSNSVAGAMSAKALQPPLKDGNAGNMLLSSEDPLLYPGTMVFDDPMSALWSLSSGP